MMQRDVERENERAALAGGSLVGDQLTLNVTDEGGQKRRLCWQGDEALAVWKPGRHEGWELRDELRYDRMEKVESEGGFRPEDSAHEGSTGKLERQLTDNITLVITMSDPPQEFKFTSDTSTRKVSVANNEINHKKDAYIVARRSERSRSPEKAVLHRSQEMDLTVSTAEFGQISVKFPRLSDDNVKLGVPSAADLQENEVSVACLDPRNEGTKEVFESFAELLQPDEGDSRAEADVVHGPMLELLPHRSHFDELVEINFDVSHMAKHMSKDEEGVLVIMSRDGPGEPWLPLVNEETLSLDDETQRATLTIAAFSHKKAILFKGPDAAEQAARMKSNSVKRFLKKRFLKKAADFVADPDSELAVGPVKLKTRTVIVWTAMGIKAGLLAA
eukprot:COSAG02_NODE_12337_length_1561_cov_1.062927_1_plen_388_part_10